MNLSKSDLIFCEFSLLDRIHNIDRLNQSLSEKDRKSLKDSYYETYRKVRESIKNMDCE